MKRKMKTIRSLAADLCLVAGMAAIVTGIAAAGYGPWAIAAAGVELVFVGFALALGRPRGGDEP